jgi:hypothetical protein
MPTKVRRDTVKELIGLECISFVLQETKLDVISPFDIMQIVGAGFDYFYHPAISTRGGILVAWQASTWSVSCTSIRWFSVSAKVRHVSSDHKWWLSSISGLSRDVDRPDFLEELHELRQVCLGPWMICGDFNMIYRA